MNYYQIANITRYQGVSADYIRCFSLFNLKIINVTTLCTLLCYILPEKMQRNRPYHKTCICSLFD